MGFVNKDTGSFNRHEYNWPEPSISTTLTPAFHVETAEDIKRQRFQSQSEVAISHSPYYTTEQKAGNQSRLRDSNVPQPVSVPKFKNIKTKTYTDLKLCESNWISYLNSLQLGMFDVNNPYVQDIAAGSVPSDADIRKSYDSLINDYNKKPFDPVDNTYVDGNGQTSTRKFLSITGSKTNPSQPTWDQYYAAMKNVTSYYDDLLKKNKDSGIVQETQDSANEDLQEKLLAAQALSQFLKSANESLKGDISSLTKALETLQAKLNSQIAQRYNSSSSTTVGAATTSSYSDLERNYAVSESSFTTMDELQAQVDAQNKAIIQQTSSEYGAVTPYKNRQKEKLSKLATQAESVTKTKILPTGNPLLLYSSTIIEIDTSATNASTNDVSLRARDIPVMHCNERNKDTVSSLKLVRSSTTINTNQEATTSAGRKALVYGQQITTSTSAVQDLFETTNFILQASNETDAEKTQIIDNFGLPQIFMFGRRPRVYSYSGYLWNNKSNNWKNEFRVMYDKYLRGTACVENGIKCLLTYDHSVRSGYILNFSMNQIADMEMAVSFNFSMFVESEKELIDDRLFDGTSLQNAFALVNAQSTQTQTDRQKTKDAIEEKLKLSPPEVAVTPPPNAAPTPTPVAEIKPTGGSFPADLLGPANKFAAPVQTPELKSADPEIPRKYFGPNDPVLQSDLQNFNIANIYRNKQINPEIAKFAHDTR